jgi:F-type H+-transporting ATPase subunit epsilon
MPFELTIVTPQGQVYHGPVDSVVLPGSEGDFGVLPGHERFLTPLRIGAVEIRAGGDHLWAAIADGFADVNGEAVALLVESCELASEIDTARAEHEKERALQGLRELDRNEQAVRYAQFEAELERAHVRLEVSRKQGG